MCVEHILCGIGMKKSRITVELSRILIYALAFALAIYILKLV